MGYLFVSYSVTVKAMATHLARHISFLAGVVLAGARGHGFPRGERGTQVPPALGSLPYGRGGGTCRPTPDVIKRIIIII